MAMTKSVTVEELAEHLEQHLAEVQEGITLEILDDDTVIAFIEPAIIYPTSTERTGDIKPGPRPKNLTVDPVQILLEDRHGSDDEIT